MLTLLERRRELMVASTTPAPSEWDYVWESTDGDPALNGWTADGSGSGSAATNGWHTCAKWYDKDVTITNGIIEAKFIVENKRTGMNLVRGNLRIGDDTNCIHVAVANYSGGYIVLWDKSGTGASTVVTCTHLASWTFGGEYVVRIVINGSSGSVAINGEVVKDNIDTTKMYYKGAIEFGNYAGTSSSGAGTAWQYVKYKSLD